MAQSQLRSLPMVFANIENLQRELEQMSSSVCGDNSGEGNHSSAMDENANCSMMSVTKAGK